MAAVVPACACRSFEPESLRVFRSCPLITLKDAQSSLQRLAIARYGCALRLDRTPFERAARSRPKNSQALSLTGSSTVAPLALEIGKRFETLNAGVGVEVQTGGSSRA